MAIKLGRIYGIPLFLDYSWFIILALIIYTVGFLIMPAQYPGLSSYEYFVLGALSALLLFVSIVVHELAHSIIAKRNGLKIRRITLYLLGGVSEMNEEPPSSGLELRMSIAGPLTSLAIAGASFVGYFFAVTLGLGAIFQGPLQYSALFNLIIAGFNLIPAFPMDGGRVLRSIIWKFSGDMLRSTRIASTVGRIFAYAMMFGGVLFSFLFPTLLFDGLWFVVIGWFISSGAQNEYRQVLIQRDIAGLRARDIMARDYSRVQTDATLSDLSSLFSFRTKEYAFPVLDSKGELVGCATWKGMQDARKKMKEAWSMTKVSEIMVPREKLVTVKENESAKQVLTLMTSNRMGVIFVLSEEPSANLLGVVTRADIVKTIQAQENYRKSAPAEAPPGSERNISVESGMLFQIVASQEEGSELSATFDPNVLALVSETLIQLATGKQEKQFTFQALKKGSHYIYLNRKGIKKDALRYVIIVN